MSLSATPRADAGIQSRPRPSRIAVLLAFALAEACILASPATLLSSSRLSLHPLVVVSVLWLVLFSMAWARASMAQADVPNGLARLAALVAYILLATTCIGLLGLSLDGVLIGLVASLIIWWRGLSLGSSELSPQQARGLFWLGLFLAGGLTMFNAHPARLVLLFIFAVAALVAVQLSVRYAVAQYNYMSASALATPRWRRATFLIVLAVLGLMVFDSALFNSEVANTVVWFLIVAIALPLAFLLTTLLSLIVQILPLEFLRQLLARLIALLTSVQQLTDGVPQQQPETELQPPSTMDPRWILFGLAALVLIAIVLFVVRQVQLRRQTQPALNDTDMPEEDQADEAGDNALDEQRKRSPFSRWFAGATVRLIYARMVAEAGRRGMPRARTQTPREFMPDLMNAFPNAEPEVNHITEAYEAAHYGQLPDTLEKLDAIRQAWERARKTPRPDKPRPAPG